MWLNKTLLFIGLAGVAERWLGWTQRIQSTGLRHREPDSLAARTVNCFLLTDTIAVVTSYMIIIVPTLHKLT